MRVVEVEQAVREVRDHCASLVRPRVVTSGNFASPVTLLGPLLAELPAARLHALNAQPDLPVHDGVEPETTFVGSGRVHPHGRLRGNDSLRHRVVDRVKVEQVVPSCSLSC